MTPLVSVARQLVQLTEDVDRKLTRVAMKLTALRVGSKEPVHPKNILRMKARQGGVWFEKYLPGKGGHVLDLGAGSGAFCRVAAEKGAYVVAIERDPVNRSLITHLKAGLEDPSQIQLLEHNLEEFPYPVQEGIFDAVISHDVIEHLHQRQKHLIEAAKALKPGGLLIIAGPNRMTAWKRIRGSLGLSTLADDDHKIEYSRSEFLAELDEGGFREILFEEPIVFDAPINGLFDMVGAISIKAYSGLIALKEKAARQWPNETSGFRMVVKK